MYSVYCENLLYFPYRMDNKTDDKQDNSGSKNGDASKQTSSSSPKYYGVRNKPYKKFIWNGYLLKPVENILHPAWILPITHGFVAQVRQIFFIAFIC